MPVFEALAYYMNGAITLFFLSWSFSIYPLRNRSRMMRLLFMVTVALSLLYIKDLYLIIVPASQRTFTESLFSIADLLCIPLTCAFLTETVRPGWATRRKVMACTAPFALCTLLYALFPHPIIQAVTYGIALLFATITLVLIYRFTWRYNRQIEDNCSNTENLSVKWVATSATVFCSLYLLYFATFGTPQINETLFNLCLMALWTILYIYARQHQVFCLPGSQRQAEIISEQTEAGSEPSPIVPQLTEQALLHAEDTGDWSKLSLPPQLVATMTEKLERLIQKEKIYLQPKITLIEVADAVCTNRTYLSIAIHQHYGKSFYDFINAYRVEEACQLMKEMGNERCTMAELADRSGFNSLSTFNRHFTKLKGKTPKTYWTELNWER